jgi:hypothetical protein
MSAEGSSVDPAFTNMTDISVSAVAMTATARINFYTEEDDPFVSIIRSDFGSIPAAQATPDLWLRFGQNTTTPLKNYAKVTDPTIGSWVGTPDFGVLDDYTRKATHFDADSYAVVENLDYTSRRALTWEVVFRTNSDGPILSAEVPQPVLAGNILSDLAVVNGRISTMGFGATSVRVDDGQWHHVMVTFGSRGLEIFVDGVSRLIRRPTTYSSVPQAVLPLERVGTNTGGTAFFNGDILMVAQYARELPREAGNLHYYAYVYATVVSAGAATAAASMPNAKGRGNKLRALALYTGGGEQFFGHGDPNWTGIRLWTLNAQGQRIWDNTPFEFGPYVVYPRKMTGQRNDYDYSPRYFTMADVEDLADFDMFFFIDAPTPHQVLDDREQTGLFVNMQPEYERFIADLRTAIDTGVSFWCPQPQLALDLGVISALDVHGLDREKYDAQSWLEDDPAWKASVSTPPQWYIDTHYNNAYRVTAQVDGFTDLPGFVMEDVVVWRNLGSPYSQRPDYAKWNVRDASDGLGIGETIYFPTDLFHVSDTANYLPEYYRVKVYSVPEGHYAGTAVAKELGSINMAGTEVPNPYSDNALTIVVQPGDSVNGAPIGGKVLVDFMSGYNPAWFNGAGPESPYTIRQIPPYGTVDYPHRDDYDGYDYDSRRMNAYFSMMTSVMEVTIVGPNSGTRTTARQVDTPMYSEAQKYPTEYKRQYTWLARGFNWLGIKDTQPEGSVRVLAGRSEATATLLPPVATGQRQVLVSAGEPARALATIVKPSSVSEPDVTVYTLPMTATATLVGVPSVVYVDAATAVATMPIPTVTGEGEDFVLQVRTYETTLFLKEDTH